MDLIIKNGTILTMDPKMRVFEKGAIEIQDGLITFVGRKEELEPSHPDKIIDARGGIIMPGLINTHTHAAMTLFRGLADDLPLMTWLNDHIFPAEAGLTPDQVFDGTLLACAEMILSGTTCFCDMYLFENETARAAAAAGMRAVVGEVLYDFPSPNYGPLDQGFEYVQAMMEEWRDHPLVTVAVEPHATYTCCPELLTRAARLARQNNSPLVIHVAETHAETSQIREKYGKTPAEFLADLGILGPDLVACHSVHLSHDDIELYREHRVNVSHCPESNMKLASGTAPIPDLISAGITVGLGTDGCASNNDLDLFSEMDTAAKLHKVISMDPTVMDAETCLKTATINGAKALGLDDKTGSLEKGKQGDIIVVDISAPHMTPMYNPYSHLVYAASGRDVTTSVIGGRVVMENRELMTMDIKEVMDRVRRIAGHIKG